MNKAFTIIEVILTIAVLSFGIIGVYGFFHSAILFSSNLSFKYTAGYLVQEGLEVMKNIRDYDSNYFFAAGGGTILDICSLGCQLDYKALRPDPYDDNQFLNINDDGLYSYDPGIPTRFKRKIIITSVFDKNELMVEVMVMWNNNGKLFSHQTTGYIYNLYQ